MIRLKTRVKITNKEHSYVGYVGTVIAIRLKSDKYYSNDYTVAIDGKYDSQHTKRLKKVSVDTDDIRECKTVKAYCYYDGTNYFWKDTPDSMRSSRIPELDIIKEVLS